MAGFTPVSSMVRNELPDFIGVDQLRRRNALADMEMQVSQQNAANFQRSNDLNAQRQQMAMDAATAEQQAARRAEQVKVGQSILGFLDANEGKPEFAQVLSALQQDPESMEVAQSLGVDVSRLADRAYRMSIAPRLGMEAPKPVAQFETQRIPGGGILQRDPVTGKLTQVVAPRAPAAPPRPPAAPAGYRWNPDGSLAVIPGGPADRRDPPPPAAELKARRDARQKLVTVDAAMRRVERLAAASEKLGNAIADGGPVDGFLLSRTPSGQELVQSAASLMPALTALTRVPGIGAQSDLEQRLAQLQLPDPSMYPDVRARAVEELRLFMSDLRNAYLNAAGMEAGTSAAPSQTAPAQSGGWSIQEIR